MCSSLQPVNQATHCAKIGTGLLSVLSKGSPLDEPENIVIVTQWCYTLFKPILIISCL